jgi:hypothetical protein
MPITDERAMNDLFIHPSLHPCRTGWENQKTNSGDSCSLQQARMRRRRVWMRISFLFIHPNLCNSITVSKRPAGWRMPITDEPTMNHLFIHPYIHPYPTGCENGWCFESTSAAENVKPGDVIFHPFFSFFSSNFVECELCRVDVDGFCFRCKRKFLSTVLKTRY